MYAVLALFWLQVEGYRLKVEGEDSTVAVSIILSCGCRKRRLVRSATAPYD